MPRRVIPQLVALVLLLPDGVAAACEYCVREVGFVALHNEPYRVVIAVSPTSTDAERDNLLAEARATLGPGNVVVSVGTVEDGGQFTDVVGQIGDQLPAALVYAPDTRSRVLALSSGSDDQKFSSRVGELTHSPAREGLAAALIDGYATVLLIEGTDTEANTAARDLAEAVIQRINAVKSGFDRVIEVGPALRIITTEQRASERWLLWSLGIDDGSEAMPSVAVLYGKGRRLGDVLSGNTLTDTALFTMLSVVARDCECDLDRGWLYGTSIPLVWDDAMRRRAYDALGFDPESAATRAAVSRILERGPGSGTSVRDPFTEDTGTNIGIPGLTIHELGDPASSVPPALNNNTPRGVVPAAVVDPDTDATSPTLGHSPMPAPASSTADKPKPMKTVLLVLGGLALVVALASTLLVLRLRGSH